MNIPRTLFVSSVARTLFLIFNVVVSFFMMPFIVGQLGDHWYGIWVILGSFATYYYILDFGLAFAVTRYVTTSIEKQEYEQANIIINTSLVIYSLIAVLILVVAAIIAFFSAVFVTSPEELRLIRIVIVVMGLNMAIEFPFKAFAGIIQAYLRYDLLTYSHFISFSLRTMAVLYFLSHGHGILTLSIISLCSNQLSNVMFFFVARHLFQQLRIDIRLFRKSEVKELFTYSIWAFLTQIANQMRFRVDSLVIGGILSASAVTHYFIGARLVEYFRTLVYKATNMMTPVFTKYHARNDKAAIREKLLFITRINTILAIFGGGIIIIVGKAFIINWMGPDYTDAYPVLITLILAIMVQIIVNPLDNLLYAINRHRFLAILNSVEGLVNLMLSLILIHRYGILGVAVATAIPLLVARIFFIPVYACRQIELSLWKYLASLGNIIGFSVFYLAITYWLSQARLTVPSYMDIMTITVVAGVIYVLIIPFIFFSRKERNLLLSMVRR